VTNRFQGDPKLYLTPDGADLDFIGGQPVMDAGFENQVFISLFTASGWWGNDVIRNTDEQIGSDFEKNAKGTITLTKLNDVKQQAENALAYQAFGNVDIEVTNPVSTHLNIKAVISPPGRTPEELILTSNGQNWINQANEGAG
jgi:phage gp46-like protein